MFSSKSDVLKDRLAKILNEYQRIADSDPDKLRAMIPPEEVWRFFMEGNLQEEGRGLSYSAYFEKVKPETLAMTIKEYVEEYEKIKIDTPSDWKKSKFRNFLHTRKWQLSDKDCEQMTLDDLLHLDKAWIPFEINEPGYNQALYKAFQEIFRKENKITAENSTAFIKKLHKISAENVKGTAYDDDDEDKIGEFRNTPVIHYGLTKETTSEAGFLEILQRGNPQIFFEIMIFDVNRENVGSLKINWLSLKKIKEVADRWSGLQNVEEYDMRKLSKYFETHNIDKFLYKIKNYEDDIAVLLTILINIKSNEELAKFLHELQNNNMVNCLLFLLSEQSAFDTQNDLEEGMRNLFQKFEMDFNLAKNPIEKLYAIIEYIEASEQLHPFVDATGRSFYLELECFLQDNGFPLAILPDPNCFGGKSKGEILEEMIIGFENTLKLAQGEKLYNVDSIEILKYLQSKPYLKRFADYFDQCVAIEREAREKYSPKPK